MSSQDSGKDNIYSAPSADLHVLDDLPPVRIERVITNPFSLTNLRDLFFFPSRFFAASVRLDAKYSTLLVVWLVGIVYSIDRIDTKMMRTFNQHGDLTQLQALAESWPYYLGTIMGAGIISAALLWLIKGWWYRLRISFCGEKNADPTVAREVCFYAELPTIVGTFFVLFLSILRFDNYADEFYSEGSLFDLPLYFLPLAMIIWSVIVSFVGVKTKFNLHGRLPVVWFLVLPFVFYAFALSALVYIFSIM